jgi:hypothetical protein
MAMDFWAYGETNRLSIGSGLKVGGDGVSLNHNFRPPKDAISFAFIEGDYVIEVYARILNRRTPLLLSTVKLLLSREQATALSDPTNCVLLTWGPDSQSYRGNVSESPATPLSFLTERP